MPPSGLDATAQSTIRQLGIGYRLPKMRTHRAGRRKQNPIRIIDNSRSDNINALPLSSQTTGTLPNSTAATGLSDNHRHRDLISVSLQPDSQSFNAGFRTALFNAQSVGSSEKRAEISTYVSDNGIDLLFITETWLNPRGDEAKIADLAPSGYSARSFPRRSHGGGLAVIFRDTLATNLTFKTKFNFDHTSFELIQVSVTLQTSTYLLSPLRACSHIRPTPRNAIVVCPLPALRPGPNSTREPSSLAPRTFSTSIFYFGVRRSAIEMSAPRRVWLPPFISSVS